MSIEESPLVQALEEIWSFLPDIIGNDWPKIEKQLVQKLRDWDSEEHSLEHIGNLRSILLEYPKALELLDECLSKVESTADDKQSSSEVYKKIRKGVGSRKGHRKGRFPKVKSSTKRLSDDGNSYVSIQVFYATDRKNTEHSEVSKRYSGKRGDLQFGTAQVTIPKDHKRGNIEKPSMWLLEFSEDPEKHVVLKSVHVLKEAEFIRSAKSQLSASEKAALIFIHGYKTSFENAAKSAAQLTYDLEYNGIPMMYSWPSEDKLLSYTVDEANVESSTSHFEYFLRMTLAELGAEKVHIIAHSMGNRVLTDTLSGIDLSNLPEGSAVLEQVVFAAPDVDKGKFENLARKFSKDVGNYTLYTSSKDYALEASCVTHGTQRAGDSDPEVTIVPFVDTIDTSDLKANFLGLGHSYFSRVDSVIKDIIELIERGLSPDLRGLIPQETRGMSYWKIKV